MARITQLDPNLRQSGGGSGPIRYLPLDAPGLRVTGLLGWEEEQVLHRLPRAYRAVFETVNPAVAALGRDTAGGQLSFRSDTRALWLRAELEAPVELCHMTAIGQGGFDCYAGTDRRELAFVGVSKFPPAAQSYQCELVPHQALRALDRGAPGRKIHEFTVNFPLYCGVRHLEIGVDPEAAVLPPSPPAQPGSLVFYGTSITQGACASRPGLSYPALLSRALLRQRPGGTGDGGAAERDPGPPPLYDRLRGQRRGARLPGGDAGAAGAATAGGASGDAGAGGVEAGVPL